MSKITLYTTYSGTRPPTVMTGCILAVSPERLAQLVANTPVMNNAVMGVAADLDKHEAVPIQGFEGLYIASRLLPTLEIENIN